MTTTQDTLETVKAPVSAAVLQFEAKVNCIAFNHTCLTLRGSHVNYITVDPIAGAQLGDRYVVVMSKVAIGGGE